MRSKNWDIAKQANGDLAPLGSLRINFSSEDMVLFEKLAFGAS